MYINSDPGCSWTLDLDMTLGRSPGPDDTTAPDDITALGTGHSDWHDIVLGCQHGPGLDVTLAPGGSPDPCHVLQWYQESQTATQTLAKIGLLKRHTP